MEEFEDLDIYNDLDEFQAVEDKKSKELQDLEAKYQQSLETNELLKLENKQLQKKIKTLEVNFQNLLDTAKAEIQRKNKLIDELRKEKDDICFRRNNTQNPFKTTHKVRPEVETTRPERQNSSDEKSARSQHNGRMRQQDEHIDIKVDAKKEYERKTQKIEDNHIFSRRDDKRLPRRDSRDRDRSYRRRSRSRNRRSRSRSKSREIHKSNVDARSIINSKAKRKHEYENVAKEAKRPKIVEPPQEKPVNEQQKDNEVKNGSSDKNVGEHTSEPTQQKKTNDSVDSVEETLKNVANSIENIVEELKKEIGELAKDTSEKTDIQPTIEQKESHSFDDYLELFAETDLSDAETPVNTPLKKENANVLLSDLCEPIESEEEMEDMLQNNVVDKIDKKKSQKEKHRNHDRKKHSKTEELKQHLVAEKHKKRINETHKNLFGDSDEDEEKAKDTHTKESVLPITITSPKKCKENTDKEKELKKSPVPQQVVELMEQKQTEQEMPVVLKDVENLAEKEHQLKDIEEVLISIENENNNNIEISQCLMQDLEEKLLVKETLMETITEAEADILSVKTTLMDASIEDSSVSKKLMDNIFSSENNHSWLGFKIPKVNAKTESKIEEENVTNETEATLTKTRPRIRRRKVTVVKKVDNEDTTSSVENIKEDETEAVTTDTTNETTETDNSEIISPKTSALLDEIFEKSDNVKGTVEPQITPQCSPIVVDSEVELRMQNIFQSPLQTAPVANDRPTIISNISLATNNHIMDLMLEKPQSQPAQNAIIEQAASNDSFNLSEISADAGSTTMNSSTETKEVVMGSSKYVFEKVSDKTVHLFITRSRGRRRKKVATQLSSPIGVPTMET